MKRTMVLFSLFVILCVSIHGDEDTSQTLPGRNQIETIVAIVNDSAITLTELLGKINRELYLRGIIPGSRPSSAFRRRLLEELVEDELLIQEARKKNIEPPAEIIDNFADRFVDYVKSLFPDDQTFLRHIDARYIDFVDFKRRVRRWEERDYMMNAVVSRGFVVLEKDIRAFREQMKSEGKPTVRYHISHIFLKFPPNAGELEKDEVEKKALDILYRIQTGADFEDMAAKFSEDEATRKRGGDLGNLDEGTFAAPIEEAVRDMREGQLTLPIRTETGIHLVKLIEKTNAESLLFRKRFQEERKKLLEELRENAVIRIMEDNVKSNISRK